MSIKNNLSNRFKNLFRKELMLKLKKLLKKKLKLLMLKHKPAIALILPIQTVVALQVHKVLQYINQLKIYHQMKN